MNWIETILREELDGMDESAREDWIDDLESHGCASGMVGSLIHYTQTQAVYDENEEEILSTLDDLDFDEEPRQDVASLVNARVWAAFEACARSVYEEMEWDSDEDSDEDSNKHQPYIVDNTKSNSDSDYDESWEVV